MENIAVRYLDVGIWNWFLIYTSPALVWCICFFKVHIKTSNWGTTRVDWCLP